MSEKTLKLARGYILVRPHTEEKTEGGIHLPQEHRRRQIVEGTVLAAGGRYVHPSGVQIDNDFARGEKVYYGAHAGHEFKDGLLIHFNDVVAWEG